MDNPLIIGPCVGPPGSEDCPKSCTNKSFSKSTMNGETIIVCNCSGCNQ